MHFDASNIIPAALRTSQIEVHLISTRTYRVCWAPASESKKRINDCHPTNSGLIDEETDAMKVMQKPMPADKKQEEEFLAMAKTTILRSVMSATGFHLSTLPKLSLMTLFKDNWMK